MVLRPGDGYGGLPVKRILETERLALRELCEDDYDGLCLMLRDAETMYAYEHAFSEEEARAWLRKQLDRYEEDGFGLWAVLLKETGELVGQCGLTMQDGGGFGRVLEVGYIFNRAYWHRGYASEAARACRDYAFRKLGAKEVFSIIRDCNRASVNVALRNGMEPRGRMVKHYYDMDMPHTIYSVRLVPEP